MYNKRITVIWYLLFLYGFATSLENKSTGGLPDVYSVKKPLGDDTSHEEIHSKNGPSISIVEQKATLVNNNNTNNNDDNKEPKKKIKINTKKTLPVNKTAGKHESVNIEKFGVGGSIVTEGGTFNLTTTSIVKSIEQNITKNVHNDTDHLTQASTPSVLPQQQNVQSEKPKHKRIHARPGVSFEPISIPTLLNMSMSTTEATTKKNQKKPLFTMINNKEIDTNESFIESPTTGRDYVLPIVLIILALPVVGYIIKLIYRRGTEFTERQQYHRMYLIDGMYNSR